MTKQLIFLFFSVGISAFPQKMVHAKLLGSETVELQSIVGIDNFGIVYTIDGSVFHKLDPKKDLTYSNVQLGNISTANIFNPLKINLFYKGFNTVVILDNRLAEIKKIDFNTVYPYKNVSHIATGYDNTIWIFNNDLQQLELYDYKSNSARATTLPVQSRVLDLASNYNYCWLLTEDHLYKYNYFGSLVSKIKNEGYIKIEEDNGNLCILGNEGLFYLPKDMEVILPIPINELLINQFLVTNETLYIYDSKTLHQFQLIIE